MFCASLSIRYSSPPSAFPDSNSQPAWAENTDIVLLGGRPYTLSRGELGGRILANFGEDADEVRGAPGQSDVARGCSAEDRDHSELGPA